MTLIGICLLFGLVGLAYVVMLGRKLIVWCFRLSFLALVAAVAWYTWRTPQLPDQFRLLGAVVLFALVGGPVLKGILGGLTAVRRRQIEEQREQRRLRRTQRLPAPPPPSCPSVAAPSESKVSPGSWVS